MEARLRSKYALIDKNDFATIAAAQKVIPGARALPRTHFRINSLLLNPELPRVLTFSLLKSKAQKY